MLNRVRSTVGQLVDNVDGWFFRHPIRKAPPRRPLALKAVTEYVVSNTIWNRDQALEQIENLIAYSGGQMTSEEVQMWLRLARAMAMGADAASAFKYMPWPTCPPAVPSPLGQSS